MNQHRQLEHIVSRYSPDGVNIIVECDICKRRFILPVDHAPRELFHYPPLADIGRTLED